MADECGSLAWVIGLPITSLSAPAWIAFRGVWMRFWSLIVVPAGRMPGTTRRKSLPNSFLKIVISLGEQITPSQPEFFARVAKVRTWSSIDE